MFRRHALWMPRRPLERAPRVLLVGPYDPTCGEYTFLAPPLGVWRLAGVLVAAGYDAEVFDPNCCDAAPEDALTSMLEADPRDIVGISTTGMTLQYDMALAHLVRRVSPDALLVAGGMEATFDPELIYRLAPFDLIVLGEGELPLLALTERLASGAPLDGIPGTAVPLNDGSTLRLHGPTLGYEALRDAIALTPYSKMPYPAYWDRLEYAYEIDALPQKAEREARLAEIRSVRLITLNYCPMACTFCSSTNFLHAAQGKTAKIARLNADDCMRMIGEVVSAQPDIRTLIFQDDIFVFTNDRRIEELCDKIQRAKERDEIPRDLQFISTNRIDAMTPERLSAMKRAGFRVVGFGVESFSQPVLKEFNKGQIFGHIEPALQIALELGLRPFLDLILCSPRSTVADIATTIREVFRWALAGCEIGLYPYVVPFSGAKMAGDPELADFVTTVERKIAGTSIVWSQPDHILPIRDDVRALLEKIVQNYERTLESLTRNHAHIPSRARSLVWITSAIPLLQQAGERMPSSTFVLRKLAEMLPRSRRGAACPTDATPSERVA